MSIIIDGVTAVGKTTFCHRIAEAISGLGMPCKVFEENFDHELLKIYLSNPKEHSKMWTEDITRRKIETYKAAEQFKGLAIIDRSCLGDVAISKMRLMNGELDPEVYEWQLEQFKPWIEGRGSTKIFLDCQPEVIKERCEQRARPGEESYTLEFFTSMRLRYHELIGPDWIILDTWGKV